MSIIPQIETEGPQAVLVITMAEEDTNFIYDVAVVGGGPAGIMAAGAAAETGAKVILIEKNKQLGRKLLLTGGGRCNVTNTEFNLKKLVENYGKDGKFLFHAFFVFGPEKVIKFFNDLGVKTKVENFNRVFPEIGNALVVLGALNKYLLKNNVNISFDSQVSRVILHGSKIEKLVVGDREIVAKNYIFCTGGKSYSTTGSTGEGLKWASDLGHNVTKLSPALVPVKIKESWVKDLQGIALKDVKVTILQNKKKHLQEIGDIMFTHFGLSGPIILDMSEKIGELLKNGEVEIFLDFLPNLNNEALNKNIIEIISKNPKKSVKVFLENFIQKRFVPIFIKDISLDGNRQANTITKEERKALVNMLKNIKLTVIELLGFDLAMVTSGGVSLKEIDDKTMKSKIIDNLFFAGEMINVNGKTGGFNLQACWSTGYLAGKSAAMKK